MIICLLNNQKFSKHKHPINKNESYTVIFGDLYVDIYNKNNCFENTIKLNKFNTPYIPRWLYSPTLHKRQYYYLSWNLSW